MMSVRPDVLPQPALVELAKMQDGVEGFEQSTAIAMVEQELGAGVGGAVLAQLVVATAQEADRDRHGMQDRDGDESRHHA